MNLFARLLKSLARGIAMLSPSCRQVSRLQTEALERKLTFLQRVGLRMHLGLCKWCRRYGKQTQFLRGVAHEHPELLAETAPHELHDAARERMKQRLRVERSKAST
jgi:hypothetical protein